MKPFPNPLTKGAVIRTHPQRGYWGCAVVLTARDGTADMYPACHVAVTVLIRRRRYSWGSVDLAELEIVRSTPGVRVGPYDYRDAPRERTCIGIYTVKRTHSLDIIGQVDPTAIYARPLTFDVGDGSGGAYPLCGLMNDRLGWQAVVAWRSVHDRERFERDQDAGMEQFEKLERERLATARDKRQARRGVVK